MKYNFSLSRDEIGFSSNWSKIEAEVENNITSNLVDIKEAYRKLSSGVFEINDWSKYFTLTGSLRITSLDELRFAKNYFTNVRNRYFYFKTKDSVEIHLRGPRYLAAIDPQLSIRQIFKIFYNDINDGILFLYNYKYDNYNQYLELLPILDYIKNALITIYNSYTHREKFSDFEFNNLEYQKNKSQLIELINHAVICYYLSMVNNLNKNNLQKLLSMINMGFIEKVINTLLGEYRDLKFSSRTVVRPEASHPILLGAFAFNLVNKFPRVKIVFGLPSGGTEIASLIHMYYKYLKNNENKLIMLPISIHTAKKEFDKPMKVLTRLKKFIPKEAFNKNDINALLVDDNSSTGTTIGLASKIIRSTNPNINLEYGVVEADLIRTRLRHKDQNAKHKIANPKLYKHSVGILPISKLLHKRYDLKEIKECWLLAKHYAHHDNDESIIQEIKREVIIDSIENKYEYISGGLTEENTINEFKHTPLSNFYGVNVIFRDKVYPSVEHAYLCQKYNLDDLKSLKVKFIRELNQIFKLKGINKELIDFSNIFFDSDMPAGVVKRISNKLRNWGYQKETWDDARLELMIELLLAKFNDFDLNHFLLTTEGKYLVEGNTWKDTFWGISDEKGKNYLGRIIMNIREKYKSGKLEKPQKPRKWFARFIGKS